MFQEFFTKIRTIIISNITQINTVKIANRVNKELSYEQSFPRINILDKTKSKNLEFSFMTTGIYIWANGKMIYFMEKEKFIIKMGMCMMVIGIRGMNLVRVIYLSKWG